MHIEFPDRERLEAATAVTPDDLPRFVPVHRERDQPRVEDVPAATRAALASIPALETLPAGASVAITAGSRGIHDVPTVLETIVMALTERDLDPFVLPAMGSHGGATAEGQVETLRALGITEARLGCPIRSSMAVTQVGTDADDRPVFAAEDALAADAVLLVNRVKAHTDYDGEYESGLAKVTSSPP